MMTQAITEEPLVDAGGESDETIVRAILQGHRDQFADLVARHTDAVKRIARFALGDDGATEDIVQQVFLKAYYALDTFDSERDFGAWTRTIARNLVRDVLRRRAVESRHMARYSETIEKRFSDPSASDEQDKRLGDALRDCRGKLPEQSARVLDMRYEKSLDFQTIASELGRSVSAVRQCLTRIRAALRNCINERTQTL